MDGRASDGTAAAPPVMAGFRGAGPRRSCVRPGGTAGTRQHLDNCLVFAAAPFFTVLCLQALYCVCSSACSSLTHRLSAHRAAFVQTGGEKAGTSGTKAESDATVPLTAGDDSAAAALMIDEEVTTKRREWTAAKTPAKAKAEPRQELHEAAMAGRASKLKKLLKKAKLKKLDAGDVKGWTAFHHACYLGHADCVKLLCVAGTGTAVVTAASGQTGWELATQMRQEEPSARLSFCCTPPLP